MFQQCHNLKGGKLHCVLYFKCHAAYVKTHFPSSFLYCSGDCGIYAIKHLEYLLAKLPLDDVVDQNIQFCRDKLCVDLFYHHLDP